MQRKLFLGLDRQESDNIAKTKHLKRNGSASSTRSRRPSNKFIDNIQAREEEIKSIQIKRKSNVGEIMTPLFILPDDEKFKSRKFFISESGKMSNITTNSVLETQLKKIAKTSIKAIGPQSNTIGNNDNSLANPESNDMNRRASNFPELKADLVKQFESLERKNASKPSTEPLRIHGHKKSISDTSVIVVEVSLLGLYEILEMNISYENF